MAERRLTLRLGSARALRMADRVTKAVTDAGASAEGGAHLLRAYEAAMEVREATGLPEHDPDFLRPGRTVLILVDDVGETDPRVLAVAALAESRRSELRSGDAAAERILAPSGRLTEELTWWRALPSLGWGNVPSQGHDDADFDAGVLEHLVIAAPPVQKIALAEALDQIRHVHLWSSSADRRRAVAIARRVLHPLAGRVDEVLARRYGWWLRKVGPALDRSAEEPTTGRAP